MQYIIIAGLIAAVAYLYHKTCVLDRTLSNARAAHSDRIYEMTQKTEAIDKYIGEKVKEYDGRLHDLETGLAPDYNAALTAAKAVNDFNVGLNNLLGFDEMEVRKDEKE